LLVPNIPGTPGKKSDLVEHVGSIPLVISQDFQWQLQGRASMSALQADRNLISLPELALLQAQQSAEVFSQEPFETGCPWQLVWWARYEAHSNSSAPSAPNHQATLDSDLVVVVPTRLPRNHDHRLGVAVVVGHSTDQRMVAAALCAPHC